MKLSAINQLDQAGFVTTLGGIIEHSPWVAERAYAARPFADVAALHAAMIKALTEADDRLIVQCLRAHPDLAGKLARSGQMTDSSTAEQASAGLDRLSDDEFETFSALNTAYVEKFGFPFIIAVRANTKDSILAAFYDRVAHDRATEFAAALGEVAKISRFRLDALITG